MRVLWPLVTRTTRVARGQPCLLPASALLRGEVAAIGVSHDPGITRGARLPDIPLRLSMMRARWPPSASTWYSASMTRPWSSTKCTSHTLPHIAASGSQVAVSPTRRKRPQTGAYAVNLHEVELPPRGPIPDRRASPDRPAGVSSDHESRPDGQEFRADS
jgi:hypothetical protein